MATSLSRQRLLNGAFALNALWWAAAPVLTGLVWQHPVRIAIIALHLEVAWLFWRRHDLRAQASPIELLSALPSFVFGGLSFKLAAPLPTWPLWATCAFVLCAVWASAALWALGRNFSILPAVREVSTHSLYRIVRHPAYAGEIGMMLVCCAMSGAHGWWLAPLGVASVAARVVVEERALRRHSAVWRTYREQTPWRLLPGVW